MDPLQQDQTDFVARLEAAADYFGKITVLQERKGDIANEVERALSVLNEKDGKIGACVVVLKPELLATDPDVPGPEYKISLTVVVVTQPLFNDGDTGTGLSTETVAGYVRKLFHRVPLGGGAEYVFTGQRGEEQPEGRDAYSVTFTRRVMDQEDTRCGLPLIDVFYSPVGLAGPTNAITLTCATPGAAIYFSVDGSYPSSQGAAASPPTSTLYHIPFFRSAGVGELLRVAAEKSGLQQSGVSQEQLI